MTRDQIITALIQGPREAEALSNALYSNPKIESTAPSVYHFAFINAPERPAQIADDKFNATVYDISPEYFNAVGLRFINGHPFNRTDSTSVVVDNNFVRRRQLADPIGSQVEIEGVKYAIVGVVTNHLTDLESHNNEDYIYRLANPEHYQILIVRGEASTLEETKKYIDNEWRKLFPDKPLRTDLQRDILYAEANAYNHNLGKIFMFLTILGCTLSVSGLYSMASLNIQKRRKDIGVRKVLGASMFSILRLINKEFAIILLVAGIPGSAGGFFLTDGLLSSLYAQHITIDILPLIACSSFVMIVGIAATCATIWWAAMENPAKTLRTE